MSNLRTAAIVVAALASVPAAGLALPSADMSGPKAAASTAASSSQAMHATKGVVKSMDATKLVIRRSSSGSDMSFTLNPSTEREGNVKIGSTVEVRYRTEANQRVATVVAAAHPKAKTVSARLAPMTLFCRGYTDSRKVKVKGQKVNAERT